MSDTSIASPTMLSRIQNHLRGETPVAPVATLIGFKLTAIAPGEATITLATGPQHANPMGTLHGGILCDIADAAMGLAYASNLAEGETFTTLELKINFLKPMWNGTLTAVGEALKERRTLGLPERHGNDEKGHLVA